jgi:exodeoxyribonuclease VII small subunit
MDEAPKFEEGLASLEKLVAELEAGELGLDEALKRFEKGVKLAAHMQKALEDTGRKIEKLGADGLSPAAEDAGADDAEAQPPAEGKARKGQRGKAGSAGNPPTLF